VGMQHTFSFSFPGNIGSYSHKHLIFPHSLPGFIHSFGELSTLKMGLSTKSLF
jgi:hypothetical protein